MTPAAPRGPCSNPVPSISTHSKEAVGSFRRTRSPRRHFVAGARPCHRQSRQEGSGFQGLIFSGCMFCFGTVWRAWGCWGFKVESGTPEDVSNRPDRDCDQWGCWYIPVCFQTLPSANHENPACIQSHQPPRNHPKPPVLIPYNAELCIHPCILHPT